MDEENEAQIAINQLDVCVMRKNYEANYIDVESWEFLLFSKVKCEFNYVQCD